MEKLRVYADFNDCDGNNCCWLLRYRCHNLEDQAKELQLHIGMQVIVFYEDDGEEFEFDGVLDQRASHPSAQPRWVAVIDPRSYRLIRETSLEELRRRGVIK